MHRLVIKERLLHQPVSTHHLTVIARKHNNRILPLTGRINCRKHIPDTVAIVTTIRILTAAASCGASF